MTTITYMLDGVRIDGHAEEPAVCHAISAISQMVSGYVQQFGWGDVNISDGHLEISNVKAKYLGSDLFQAMAIALEDIWKQYPGCVRVERR